MMVLEFNTAFGRADGGAEKHPGAIEIGPYIRMKATHELTEKYETAF